MATLLQDKYEARKAEVNERFEQLRANEEELNRIFAKIYNMEGEVPIEVGTVKILSQIDRGGLGPALL